jgi:hypothetical protein
LSTSPAAIGCVHACCPLAVRSFVSNPYRPLTFSLGAIASRLVVEALPASGIVAGMFQPKEPGRSSPTAPVTGSFITGHPPGHHLADQDPGDPAAGVIGAESPIWQFDQVRPALVASRRRTDPRAAVVTCQSGLSVAGGTVAASLRRSTRRSARGFERLPGKPNRAPGRRLARDRHGP